MGARLESRPWIGLLTHQLQPGQSCAAAVPSSLGDPILHVDKAGPSIGTGGADGFGRRVRRMVNLTKRNLAEASVLLRIAPVLRFQYSLCLPA